MTPRRASKRSRIVDINVRLTKQPTLNDTDLKLCYISWIRFGTYSCDAFFAVRAAAARTHSKTARHPMGTLNS